jgi:hypothetical protein
MPMPRKPDGAKAVKTSITIPPALLAKLKARLAEGESLSALITSILRKNVK